MRLFTGQTRIESGTVFAGGVRIGYQELYRWIRENTMVIDRNRFQAKELTARDYVCAFDKNARRVRLRAEAERLFTKEADEVRQQMGILFDWDTPLTTLTMPDYYRGVMEGWTVLVTAMKIVNLVVLPGKRTRKEMIEKRCL